MNGSYIEIFEQNKKLFQRIFLIIENFKKQNFDRAVREYHRFLLVEFQKYLPELFQRLDYFEQLGLTIQPEEVLGLMKDMMAAQETEDYILLADLIEAQLLPWLMLIQETILSSETITAAEDVYNKNMKALRAKNPNLAGRLEKECTHIPDSYKAELAATGEWTLKGRTNSYFHTNINPYEEAYSLVREYYRPEQECFVICGLGLGYHLDVLYRIESIAAAEVYEHDLNIIKLAMKYHDFSDLFERGLKLFYDPDLKQMTARIQNQGKDIGFMLHYPSVKNIPDLKIREAVLSYFVQESSIRNQEEFMQMNLKHNLKNYDGYIDELKPQFEGKTVYIIAAGPSLDKNIALLKQKPQNSIIVAAGTVFRKLTALGIAVDYVIVSDANARIIGQISGVENEKAGMLLLSTAYFGFAMKYKGRKYLICQEDYKPAENYAKAHNWNLYQTGGSVSTTALDAAIRLGAAEIIFLGLDLAFTGGVSHTEGTLGRKKAEAASLTKTVSIDGGEVYENKKFRSYRKWIEKRAAREKGIVFIDATEGGSRIEGFQIKRLEEILKSPEGA